MKYELSFAHYAWTCVYTPLGQPKAHARTRLSVSGSFISGQVNSPRQLTFLRVEYNQSVSSNRFNPIRAEPSFYAALAGLRVTNQLQAGMEIWPFMTVTRSRSSQFSRNVVLLSDQTHSNSLPSSTHHIRCTAARTSPICSDSCCAPRVALNTIYCSPALQLTTSVRRPPPVHWRRRA